MMIHLSTVAVVAVTAAIGQVSAQEMMDSDLTYVGCFHDNQDDRVLGDMVANADMTAQVSRARSHFRGSERGRMQRTCHRMYLYVSNVPHIIWWPQSRFSMNPAEVHERQEARGEIRR